MSDWAAKRFWTDTTVVPEGDGFAVHLDGRPVRTPAKAPLIVPTQAFADLIAAEWDGQDGKIDPETMPATRSANVAIDRIGSVHAEVVTMIADYGDSDLLCYRAVFPEALIERQDAVWNPLLVWAETEFGARLETRAGVMHVPQSPAALARLHAVVDAMTAFELAAFHDLVSLSGSLVIGLAATRNARPVEALWDASRLDETFQIEQWGEDEDAAVEAAIKRESFLRAHEFYHAVQN
ncbi:ATP12 family chaperone protein [Celeribacter sp.]|uniref:ATP12 family chaperone protein n=1 Tax=Celeribacter sp. TaxID=1890673 RepID=UPI003A930E63